MGPGSIPARAGEPGRAAARRYSARVYPRTGGGTPVREQDIDAIMGLSPHGRGNRGVQGAEVKEAGSIPARAGEPLRAAIWRKSTRVYPRTGGGTGLRTLERDRLRGLSPHGRGNPPRDPCSPPRPRSIPARAGEPDPVGPERLTWGVYPRTGGGTRSRGAGASDVGGLSPHGRGNPSLVFGQAHIPGSIPARAGEPRCPGSRGQRGGAYPRTGGGTPSGGDLA